MDELFHRSGKLPARYKSPVFWLIRLFLAKYFILAATTILIRHLLTRTEYDREDWKARIGERGRPRASVWRSAILRLGESRIAELLTLLILFSPLRRAKWQATGWIRTAYANPI